LFHLFDRGLLLSTFDSADSATSLFGSVFSALAEDKIFSDALRRSGARHVLEVVRATPAL
jgi:hypothetical protein